MTLLKRGTGGRRRRSGRCGESGGGPGALPDWAPYIHYTTTAMGASGYGFSFAHVLLSIVAAGGIIMQQISGKEEVTAA
jgi:hypothetical protein